MLSRIGVIASAIVLMVGLTAGAAAAKGPGESKAGSGPDKAEKAEKASETKSDAASNDSGSSSGNSGKSKAESSGKAGTSSTKKQAGGSTKNQGEVVTSSEITTVNLHPVHVGASSEGFQTGECGPNPTGDTAWHFVLNGLDAGTAPGSLAALFEASGSKNGAGAPVGIGSVQHFYVYTDGPDTLLGASAEVSAQSGTPRLVLSHVASGCLGIEAIETEIETETQTETETTAEDVSIPAEGLGVSFQAPVVEVLGAGMVRGQSLPRTGLDASTMLFVALVLMTIGMLIQVSNRRMATVRK